MVFSPQNRRYKTSRGFTLLEVTIALALLVMSLGILLQSQTSAVIMTVDAEKIRIATQLAEEKVRSSDSIRGRRMDHCRY